MIRLVSMTLELTKSLISRPSVTPDDAGCQEMLADRLKKIGFEITHLPLGKVTNLWARYGHHQPLLVFVGHTDVVPTGDINKWETPPFDPIEKDGYLYGRGAQDMKSGIAAMVIAVERFIQHSPQFAGSIGFLITSDEEGPSVDGTAKVVEYLKSQCIAIQYCIVGEPSSQQRVGDMIKIGRRGSLSGSLVIHGKQGHIAYPHLAENPIHYSVPVIKVLLETEWDNHQKLANFDKTSFQISNIHSGTGANNVIPNDLELLCNFRYSPIVSAEQLRNQFEQILIQSGVKYSVTWQPPSLPFLTEKGKLLDTCQTAIQALQQITPILSTTGGTSDGRFIAPTGAQVVELGLCNNTIHQINERVKMTELDELSCLYQKILENLFWENQ